MLVTVDSERLLCVISFPNPPGPGARDERRARTKIPTSNRTGSRTRIRIKESNT